MQIFVVGHVIDKCDAGVVWDILGVFSEKNKAELICYDSNCFVGPLEINKPLPKEIIDWPGCYFPISNQAAAPDAGNGGADNQ